MTAVTTRIQDGVGTITLNRPEQLNAVTVELARGLDAALRTLGGDPAVAVVVVRGAGGNFCAGGDFHEVERLRAAGPAALRELFTAFSDATRAVAEVPVPVIAAVEGAAAAGGFEFMQAADIVLVADDAKIADSHIRFGQVPGGGSTQRLPRIVGRQLALGLLMSGDRISGLDAVRLGLAYRAWPAADFEARLGEFVASLAARNGRATREIKRLVYAGLTLPEHDGLDAEIAAVVNHISAESGGSGADVFAERNA